MIRQTTFPFKIENTDDIILPLKGLALVGEFSIEAGSLKYIDNNLPKNGSSIILFY